MTTKQAQTDTERGMTVLTKVRGYLDEHDEELASLLGDIMSVARFKQVALQAIQGNAKLLECSPISLVMSIRRAAEYGLELGPLGDASLVPYDGEATLQVEYRGYRNLALRSGAVRAVGVDVVYTNDKFRIFSGSEPRIEHEPALGERGDFRGAYAYARLTNGELLHVWMPESELVKRRDVSRSWRTALKYGRTDSIWHLWGPEMRRKTVIKRLANEQLPLSPKDRQLMVLDTEADLPRPERPRAVPAGDVRKDLLLTMGITPREDASEGPSLAESEGSGASSQPEVQEAPPTPTEPQEPVEACCAASPYPEHPDPCFKVAGHRLLHSNGKGTW